MLFIYVHFNIIFPNTTGSENKINKTDSVERDTSKLRFSQDFFTSVRRKLESE
jgi:hypothetical protein